MQKDNSNEKNNQNSIMESGERSLKKVDDTNLSDANGGYIFDTGFWSPVRKRYEVIDDANGKVLGRYSTETAAMRAAYKKQQSTKQISWRELNHLRDAGE